MSAYNLTPDGTVQTHAWRSDDGHWSAAFDWFPQVSFGGDTARVAAKRLVRSANGLDEKTLRVACRSKDGLLRATCCCGRLRPATHPAHNFWRNPFSARRPA